jgi:hypothetical protein
MIAEHTWRTRFAADPGLVERVLWLGSVPQPTTVVGVLPEGAKIDTTLVPQFVQVRSRQREYPRGQPVSLLARMKPGVTPEAVETELRAITPGDEPGVGKAVPAAVTPAELYLGDTFSRGVWLVFAGAIALLAVAIVNAGHLLLGRAAARSHELGVRLALGGSGLRLARLFLAEAFVYLAASVAVGAGIMVALEKLIRQYEPRLFMTMDGAGLEGRAIWFIVAVAGVAMLACAAVPLLRSRHQDSFGDASGDAGRSTSRGSRAMRACHDSGGDRRPALCGAGVIVRVSNLLKADTGMALISRGGRQAAPPALFHARSEGAYLIVGAASGRFRRSSA